MKITFLEGESPTLNIPPTRLDKDFKRSNSNFKSHVRSILTGNLERAHRTVDIY